MNLDLENRDIFFSKFNYLACFKQSFKKNSDLNYQFMRLIHISNSF